MRNKNLSRQRLIIIGAGPGGYVAAIRAAQQGLDVTVVEERELGGTCLNRGCIPTKAIISSVEVLEKIRHSALHGITINGEVEFNIAAMIARKNKVVSNLTKGIAALLKANGIRLVQGRGVITGKYTVDVTGADGTVTALEADGIIIATGSNPWKIPLFPFDGDKVLTSDDAVNMQYVPESVLIVGAGVIGAEFAFIYSQLGSRVTMVEMMPKALATCDEEIINLIQREMRKRKIDLMVNTRVDKVEIDGDNVRVSLDSGKEITVDQVLVSTGRSMNSSDIGLESIGVKTDDRGVIQVNSRMETSVDKVYAIGDIVGGLMLAHVASTEGSIAVENFIGNNVEMDTTVVPAGIFTSPEIGTVGLTEQGARDQGLDIKVGKFSFKGLGKAHALGEAQGIVKLISDRNSDKIVGGHIIGPHATDLIHEVALAMKNGLAPADMAHTIHAHPTLSEGVLEAAEDLLGMAVHSPPVKKR